MKKNLFVFGLFGFLSVAIGAFAAHGLKPRLDAYHFGIFQTAITYQFYHTLALGFTAVLKYFSDTAWLRHACKLFLAGILIFSGSLYALALTQAKWLGMITPIGGLCFLAGWVCLMIASSKFKSCAQ